MALQKSLEKFNLQQQKCLSSYSNNVPIATARGIIPRPAPPTVPIATSSPVAAKFPTNKFSNNIERLQQEYSIQNSCEQSQVRRVIALLEETREAFTIEQIRERCYVDAIKNKKVFELLTHNSRVKYDGKYLSYIPNHDIKDKDELLQLIRKNTEGIVIGDPKESYRGVKEDLQALKASGKVWLLSNSNSRQDVAYPNDPKLVDFKVDDDLKLLFREVKLPQDMIGIENYLSKNGLKPKTDTAKRRATAEAHGIKPTPKDKKKPRNISKRTKLTNKHLPELFQDWSRN